MISGVAASAKIPSYEKMVWPTLQVLRDMGGSGTIQEIEERVIRLAGFSEAQQSVLHGDGPQTEIAYRLAWARTYLKKYGAIENSARGVWTLTQKGHGLSESDVVRIPAAVRATYSHTSTNDDITDNLLEDKPGTFSSTVFEEWRDRLLEMLQALPPDKFEKLCQRVLRESGFTKVEVTGRSGDGGIDGMGVLRVSLLSFQVFFQCKRYKGSVGASAVRDFRGAMVGRSDKGLLITTGTFTGEAVREATRDGAPALDLIDGEQLCRILKDLKLGVSTRQVEEVTIDAGWFVAI